jgi:predicted nucleotidyltransferase
VDTISEIKEKEIKPLLRQVVKIVREHVPADSYHILLFGSWATLQSTPTSDIDVGILGPASLDGIVMARIREQIDRLPTLRKIEVVDLRSVEDRFLEEAGRNAERVA